MERQRKTFTQPQVKQQVEDNSVNQKVGQLFVISVNDDPEVSSGCSSGPVEHVNRLGFLSSLDLFLSACGLVSSEEQVGVKTILFEVRIALKSPSQNRDYRSVS